MLCRYFCEVDLVVLLHESYDFQFMEWMFDEYNFLTKIYDAIAPAVDYQGQYNGEP